MQEGKGNDATSILSDSVHFITAHVLNPPIAIHMMKKNLNSFFDLPYKAYVQELS